MPRDKETEAHQLVTKLERFIESIIDMRGPMAQPDHGINNYHDAKKQLKDVLEDWGPEPEDTTAPSEPTTADALAHATSAFDKASSINGEFTPAEPSIMLTSAEWLQQPEFEGITVLDADGWDRDNFHQSWHELLTRTQFIHRLSRSTISAPARFFE